MQVNRLHLWGFRNYDEAEVSFDPGINVISGPNAQGKTNLLEAVYMLAGGRSFRTRFDKELIGFERDFAEIEGGIFAAGRSQTIQIKLRRGLRKQILQNGVKKKSSELGESLTAVLFCPDDLNLIREGAAARRRLMDLSISQLRPAYGALISDYNRLYENKTRILKDWREKPALLDTLEDFSYHMCVLSAQIIRYRASFAEKLAAAAAPIHSEFSGRDEKLALRYCTVSSVTDPTASAADILQEVLDHQARHRDAEIAAGSCLTGIHKDDLEIEINDRSARSFASQGQARTAALSIKLAEREIHEADTGECPVLLLDDVLSELDAKRQAFVLNHIGNGQTLITCCEDEQIAQRTGGRVILVSSGQIREA